MLWACEIKYATEWSSNLTKKGIKDDVKKLRKLLKQKADGTDYACLLILMRWLKKYKINKTHKNKRKEKQKKIDKYLNGLKDKKIKLYYRKNIKVINKNGQDITPLPIQN